MTDAELLDRARGTLRSHFGYDAFRPGQETAVTAILSGRDTLTILPTGGGKSLCFQVPALMLDGLTVVVSPLISLMKDQVDALQARGIPATFINSTLGGSQVAERMAQVQRGDIRLLYVAPERFDAGQTAERLRAIGVRMLAIDEAHCISEWGHEFRPSYLRLRAVRERLGNPPTIALTATATPEVRRDIARQLALVDPITVITGFDRTNLTYYVVPVRNDAEKDASLVREIRKRDGLTIVYASTRKSVERVAEVLSRARIPAMAYHAGLDDTHRAEVQDAFMNERVRAIVATNAFGMGIDKPNVRLVVHYTMPGTLEAYYQEAGRAGRDRQPADAVLLHAFPDRFTHEFFIKGSHPERPVVERVYSVLRRAADANGVVSADLATLARMAGDRISDREVESALRVLNRFGAASNEPESSSRVWVRLLATPERIKRELGEDRGEERELLRALWRAAGARLSAGVIVEPRALPPAVRGTSGIVTLLDALQDSQFIAWSRTGGGLRLTSPASPLPSFEVDWDLLDRRRKGELAKLDAVQRYAYTKDCRRGFVLRYFGDPAARRQCEGCDNCLGISAVAAPPALGKRPSRRPKGEKKVTRDNSATATDPRLLESLRALRSLLAREAKVPAYVVFPDRTLEAMASERPRTLAALADLHGVGPARLERYGARFLEVLKTGAE